MPSSLLSSPLFCPNTENTAEKPYDTRFNIDVIIWVNTSKYLCSNCHRVVKEVPNRISGLHSLENRESPFTDCIGGQILQIKQPQQPTETFYEVKIYSPSPMRNRQKTYFIKLCTLCRLSGRHSPILQRNYNAFCEKGKWNRLISAIFSRKFRNFGCRKESHNNQTFFPIEIAGQTHSQKTVNSIFKNIGCLNGIRSDNKNRSPQRLKKGENIFKHKDG